MEELSQVLWRERELLDTLLFKLEEEQMVLASGRTRWVVQAAREVESVLQTIRETEILRSTVVDRVAVDLGLEHNPSLRALARAVSEPWRGILLDHHEAFTTLTHEVTALAVENRDLITTGYHSARQTLMTLGDSTHDYVADGSQ
jgi:hypothetical protein